jgi:glutamyl-Q tRNA(Asp) synthetase
VPGAADDILGTLHAYGMQADAPPVHQSRRGAFYQTAFDTLEQAGHLYPCGCTRREIADSLITAVPHAGDSGTGMGMGSGSENTGGTEITNGTAHVRNTTLAYPGTCRNGLHGRVARAWRLRVPDGQEGVVTFQDRWQGAMSQDIGAEVGDFALKRADGLWAYQLAVVVDDAAFGITDVVRGSDLLDSTPRQMYLQHCLGVPSPRYLHIPVLTDTHGEKLSKQNGALPLERGETARMQALSGAARYLGLTVMARQQPAFFSEAIAQWRERFGPV